MDDATVHAQARRHVVSSGESLWLIAQWYGSTPEAIRRHNQLQSTTIYPGQTLWIPGGGAGSGAGSGAGRATGAFHVTPYEFDLLARMISAEAQGEPYLGQVAVGAVILNRVRHPAFPNTIEGVIFQPYQFEPVNNPLFYRPATASAQAAARDALNNVDPTGGALFFYNRNKVNHGFFATRPFATRIGNHWFYY